MFLGKRTWHSDRLEGQVGVSYPSAELGKSGPWPLELQKRRERKLGLQETPQSAASSRGGALVRHPYTSDKDAHSTPCSTTVRPVSDIRRMRLWIRGGPRKPDFSTLQAPWQLTNKALRKGEKRKTCVSVQLSFRLLGLNSRKGSLSEINWDSLAADQGAQG